MLADGCPTRAGLGHPFFESIRFRPPLMPSPSAPRPPGSRVGPWVGLGGALVVRCGFVPALARCAAVLARGGVVAPLSPVIKVGAAV